MIFLILLVFLLIFLGIFIYRKGTANKNYFKDRNIPFLPPTFCLGNMMDIFMNKNDRSFLDFAIEMRSFGNGSRIVGLFDMRQPVHLLNDPKLIRQLTVREFDHFTDHKQFVDDTMDKLFGNSLFSMTGQKWRDMRATLSPAFTGSKMRHMFPTVVKVAEQMVEHMRKEAGAGALNEGVVEYEMKERCSRFMNDVIAVCAFGVSVNSFENPNNEFFLAGKQLINFNNAKGILKFFGFRLIPRFMKLFKIQLFDKEPSKFFRDLILGTLDHRWENSLKYNDVIDVLMRVRQGDQLQVDHDDKDTAAGFATVQESEVGRETKHKRMWTDDELVAQAFLFFLAGFDTSSTLISFTVYELMINPEIQQRLFEEVSELNEATNGGTLTYDHLKDLKYLDMVVSETLRKWPPFPIIDRLCTKTLSYEDEETGFKYTFEKGTGTWLNITGIHNDPEYYPEPRRFDPERFSDENKGKITGDIYFPFGIGPRACIGSRFALMEVKILLYYLVLNFELTVTKKTQIPLQLKQTLGALLSKDGIWVGLKKRNGKEGFHA